MTGKVKEQILKVRETGLVNMFDTSGVQYVAYQQDSYDMVNYLNEKDNIKEYIHFIMTGEAKITDEEDSAGEETD